MPIRIRKLGHLFKGYSRPSPWPYSPTPAEVSPIKGWFGEFLKRRVKDFDRYFPTRGGVEEHEELACGLLLVV